MESIVVTISGVDLIVNYYFDGKYIPATHEQPEEYPELYLQSISVADSDTNIYDLLSERQLDEINDKIWANE